MAGLSSPAAGIEYHGNNVDMHRFLLRNICKKVTCMTNYPEILRLHSLRFNKTVFAACNA